MLPLKLSFIVLWNIFRLRVCSKTSESQMRREFSFLHLIEEWKLFYYPAIFLRLQNFIVKVSYMRKALERWKLSWYNPSSSSLLSGKYSLTLQGFEHLRDLKIIFFINLRRNIIFDRKYWHKLYWISLESSILRMTWKHRLFDALSTSFPSPSRKTLLRDNSFPLKFNFSLP